MLSVKKTFTAILVILVFFMTNLPILASSVNYDFSDAAQAQFDAQNNTQVSQPVNERSTIKKEKKKKEKKENKEKRKKTNIQIQETATQSNEQPTQQTILNPEVHSDQSLNSTTKLTGQVVYIPKGTTFQGVLQSSISSSSMNKNDTIAAVLYNDWYHNNVLIAPQGSILYGKAIDTSKAGFAYGNGSLSITFNEILTPNGESIKLESNVVTIAVESQRAKKIATNVIGGAILGLVSGVLYALITGGDVTNGLAIGAGVGAGGGAIRAAANKGEEVEIPAGTCIDIKLAKPMNVQAYN